MSAHVLLLQLALVLAAGLAGGIIARAMRLPVMVGYLLAGLAVGPYTPGVVARHDVVSNVANLGVVLLMFSVGLQFSLRELVEVRREALWGGLGQIAATVLLGIGVSRMLGWQLTAGVFVGCAIALSSTAVVVRVLEERGELGSARGRIVLGILVVQDLAVIAMSVLLPVLGPSGAGPGWLPVLLQAVARAAVFIGALLYLASRGVPWFLAQIARLRSRELFVLTVVTVCMGAALAAEATGVELALGAFMAGLVVAGSQYADEVLVQIRPLRDVFASVFFVSVGMLLDPGFVVRHWVGVLALLLSIALGKPLIAALAVYLTGRHARTALQVGFDLGQIGEFSFVLAGISVTRGVAGADVAGMILAAAVLTIILTPAVSRAGVPTYHLLRRSRLLPARLEALPDRALPDIARGCESARALVLGYGRVGRIVSQGLHRASVAHTVVDLDPVAARLADANGAAVIYGDAASDTVLTTALTPCVDLVVVALPEAPTTEVVVRTIRTLNDRVPIIARVHRTDDEESILSAGAVAAIYAETLAGDEMLRLGMRYLAPGAAESAHAREPVAGVS